MPRSDSTARRYPARLLLAALLLLAPTTTLSAQGSLTRAANRVVSLTADLALMKAKAVDLADGGPALVPHGGLMAGVSSVDVVTGAVVRVHLYFLNPSDVAVTEPVPSDSAFILLDGTGRKFVQASIRSKVARGKTEVTVPALERIAVDLVFVLDKKATPEATLKIGEGTIIRGIPLQPREAAPPPPPPPTPSPLG